MDGIKSALYPFRKALIIFGIAIVLLLVLFVVNKILEINNKTDAPIVSIEAKCNATYNSIDELEINDFDVHAIHSDKKKTSVGTDDVILNTNDTKPVGEKVKVVITLKEDKSISTECEVKIKRDKILGFQCGYPNVTDVIAVLYSNGELCFEGEGDVLVFYEKKQPWLKYDEMKEYPITSVSFEKTVTPTNMNYWFEGCETITYVDTIPTSVRTMVRTFADCKALTSTADWSSDESLLNINETYKGCSALNHSFPIPERVRIAKGTFKDCIELQVTPDMKHAVNLVNTTEMFKGCSKLIQTEIPSKATNITDMFKDCINLKQMPEIPEDVVIMDTTFENDTNLTYLTNIPQKVDSLNNTFNHCEMITGEMKVDANPHEFDGMFKGAALATKINLVGESLLLDALANTSDTGNVYINKSKPNPSITKYKDVFLEEK